MATNEEVLRAFVVSLGWKNEAAQQKEFVGAAEGDNRVGQDSAQMFMDFVDSKVGRMRPVTSLN
jgi:hypothetical protein